MRSQLKLFRHAFLKVASSNLKRSFLFATSSNVETGPTNTFSGLKPIDLEATASKVPKDFSNEKLLAGLDLPYSFTGNLLEAKEYTGYMGERVFAQHKIPKNMIIDHVYKIYQGALYSMANLDEEFLGEYLEADFAKRLIDSLKKMRDSGFEIKVIEDQQGRRGEPVPLQRRMLDMTMVKGLSAIRLENKSETEYHKYVDIDDMGLVVYTPVEVTDPRNFSNPEKNKTIYDGSRQVVFRMLIEIQSPLRLHLRTPEGQEIYLHNHEYTWKHIALFETQMKEPPKFTSFSKLETFMEWLGKYKFGVWKLADLDNFMKGNPLIRDNLSREGFKDEIFKGSKYDPDATINIKNV